MTGEESTAPVLTVGGSSFECIDFVPQWNLMRLASKMNSGDDMAAMGAMYDFILYLVLPEEHERLEAHLGSLDLERSDLDNAIGDTLVAMARRGKGSGVPTGHQPKNEPASGSSSVGSGETSPTRKVVSLSRGTVREEPLSETEKGSSTG